MRYLVALFWSFVLGQVVGYIGSALTNTSYDFLLTTIVSLIAGVVICLISVVATPKKDTAH